MFVHRYKNTLHIVCVNVTVTKRHAFSTKFFWAILEKCETDCFFFRINQTWCMWKVKSFSFSVVFCVLKINKSASQPAICRNGPSCVFLGYPFMCFDVWIDLSEPNERECAHKTVIYNRLSPITSHFGIAWFWSYGCVVSLDFSALREQQSLGAIYYNKDIKIAASSANKNKTETTRKKHETNQLLHQQ